MTGNFYEHTMKTTLWNLEPNVLPGESFNATKDIQWIYATRQ